MERNMEHNMERKPAKNKFVIRFLLLAATVVTVALVLGLIFAPQLLTLEGTPPPVPGDDWPTYMHDIQRTGANNAESVISSSNVGQLSRLWAFKTGGGFASSASIVKGTAYFGSWDGYEYAVDAVKGFLKWKTNLGQTVARCVPPVTGITSSATILNNVVYVGGGDSYWYALDAYTGSVLWKVYTGDTNADAGYYNWSSPLIYQGFAYIGIASDCDNPLTQGKLLKVDLSTHQVVAIFKVVPDGEVGGGIWTTPAVDTATNTIYVTTGTRDNITQTLSQAIVAINPENMTLKDSWQIPLSQSGTDDDWGTTPNLFTDAQGQKLVEATNKNGFTYAFDRAHIGAGPLWERQTSLGGTCPACGDGSVSSAVFANGLLYMAGGKTTINGVGYMGSVRAIDPTTGKYVWEHGDPNAIIGALAYANGLVFAAEGSNLEALDAQTGERLYNYQTDDGIYAPPSVSHGQVFIGSLDGNLYSFGLPANTTPPPSDAQCPRGWSCQDVGNPRTNGSENYSNKRWSIVGTGPGLANIADQLRFINQTVSGNIQIQAHILSQQTSQAALMVRQSLYKGSPFYAVSLSPTGELTIKYRTGFDGGLTTIGSLPKVTLPSYLEIQRVDDQFRAAISTDGTHYTLLPGSNAELTLPTKTFVGIAANSSTNGTAGVATYDDVTIGTPAGLPAAPLSLSPCASNWSCSDIGNPQLVGDQVLTTNGLTLKGAGQDIWGVADQFRFVWQQMAGNSTISAHILAQTNTNSQAKAGIMLRSSIDANAPYYAAFVTPGAGLIVQYRSVPGLDTHIFATDNKISAPIYLQVARWNNIFTTYTSTDGVNWTPVAGSSIAIEMNNSLLLGLVTTSHKATALNTATFAAIKTVNSASPAPTACPPDWQCGDIGYPAPQGSQIYNAATDTWTLGGGGYDIFFQQDQFHYVWQPLQGDGTIIAHIITQTNTDPAAKAGVMLRADTSLDAPYYAAFVTPAHGISMQSRAHRGDNTNEVLLPDTDKAPVYLEVQRVGDTFTAYTSQDDVTWTPIPGSSTTIDMGPSVLAGLAVTSHNISYISVVTFDTVSISNP
jgi:outer membrane protein assembly factor BamB